jgi:alpha-amylase
MNVCLYLQMHQPHRVARYRVFDIGTDADYFDPGLDRQVLERVAERSYRPALALLADRVVEHEGRFRFALGVTSTLLAQMEASTPDVIAQLRDLVETGCVEIVAETSHHSLSGLFDRDELAAQVRRHAEDVERLLDTEPTTFRNTEMLFSDEIARFAAELGYKTILTEGAESVLGMRSPNRVYAAAAAPSLRVLARNYRLADDIGFRFSDEAWGEWPLSASRYADWIAAQSGDSVNIFLDFETLGEHHRADTRIFDFVAELPLEVLRRGIGFHLPKDSARLEPVGTIAASTPISWADRERDESAWLGNRMQRSAAERLYALLPAVRASGDEDLLETWRRLSTSDHLYYISTKGLDDGGVHAYFSPFDSPYDAFIALMNVLADFERRLGLATSALRSVAA